MEKRRAAEEAERLRREELARTEKERVARRQRVEAIMARTRLRKVRGGIVIIITINFTVKENVVRTFAQNCYAQLFQRSASNQRGNYGLILRGGGLYPVIHISMLERRCSM